VGSNVSNPFADLPRAHYGAIYADPPWGFKAWSHSNDGGAARHYNVMTTKDIIDLRVVDIASPNSVLFIWSCWPQLLDTLDVIEAWGFEYKTCAFAWLKANNKQIDLLYEEAAAIVGLGYWTRANSEVCLLATRGHPKRLNADVRQGIIEPRREHSRKPDCVPGRIERLVAGPYIELFARTTRPGWDCWGNQTDKFAPSKARCVITPRGEMPLFPVTETV
jgi:N6-adenosine-specific RNA methylase IME4